MLKKYKYREKVMGRAGLIPNHPVKEGVQMQAHHLVSAKGVDLAGLSSELEHLGYDINDIDNLVLIPSTLQSACHLNCQLHRGNHTHVDKDGDSSDDDVHPRNYHQTVQDLLDSIRDRLKRGTVCDKSKRKLQSRVNELSKKLLDKINDFRVPLTSIWKSFKSGSTKGCQGKDSIGAAKLSSTTCAVDRDHEKRSGHTAQGPSQKEYDIKVSASTYRLEVGR